MIKKTALRAMQSPEKAPGISQENEVHITQPVGKTGPPEPGGEKPDRRMRGSSDWFSRIDGIAGELESYQNHQRDPVWLRVHRERFYQGVWELAERWSRITLHSWEWKGDVTQDAKDITAAFCERLTKQESNRRGIFSATDRSPSQVRGYLSNAIRQGVRQETRDFARKRRDWLHFDEDAILAAEDARQADWLPQVLRLATAVGTACERAKKLPMDKIGSTPIEFILRLALDQKISANEGVKDLFPQTDLPLRSRQRREKNLRDDLRREMEM